MKELKKMSYATGLGPHFPWLLLQSTVKVSLFIWSAFSPEAADREGGDHVLWTQPILSSTKPSLSLVMKYKTLHRSQKKNISQSSSLPRDFLKFWKLQPTVLSNVGFIFAYACFCIVFPFWGRVAIWAVRGNPWAAASAWASESALCAACAAEHLEVLDPFSLPSMQRTGTTKPTAISRPSLEEGVNLQGVLFTESSAPSLRDQSKTTKWEMQVQRSDELIKQIPLDWFSNWVIQFLPSSLPPLPMSHLQTSKLGRWKQNVSSSDVSQFTVYTNTNNAGFLPSTAVSQCYWGAEKHLDFLPARNLEN